MLSLMLAALSAAGPMDGWAGSRWHVQIEETFPLQLPIAGPLANPPVLRAVQIDAIVACPEVKPSGKSAIYVTCKLEGLGMRASPQADPEKRLDEYKEAFAGLSQVMLNGSYELKLKDDGRVTTVDFAEPPKSDPITVQAARAFAIDLFNGFSLERAEVPAGASWDETNSPLIRAATQPLAMGRTKIQHVPAAVDGQAVIDSMGDGLYSSDYLSWSSGRVDQASGGAAAAAGGDYGSRGQTVMTPAKNFDALFDSVALLGDGNGPFQQRYWTLVSTPKLDASDMTGVQGTPLWAAGTIKRLDATAKPDLGQTTLVGAPGTPFPGLPAWTPMSVPWDAPRPR